MGQLVFQATLGGQVNLVGPNTASTFNINVPATAGNMVTTGDTGTVTSTMLATSVYTAPGTIGSGTANTGAFTTLTTSSTVTHNGGTANGVAYLNGSKVLTTGSALVFDGTNLGVGTTSPAYPLDVVGASSGGWTLNMRGRSADNIGYMRFSSNNGATNYAAIGTPSANTLAIDVGGAERARIDSSGNLLVGTTSQENLAKTTITFTSANNGLALNETSNSNNTLFLFFRQSSTTIGSVTRVGTTSAVTYNTTSDYRLKDVIGAVSGSGERIDALKPINFKWTENDSQSRGFLAHEFQTVYPNSVTGDKDAIDADGNPVYQAMQASTPEVIADLVAEIQDLRKRLAALESK